MTNTRTDTSTPTWVLVALIAIIVLVMGTCGYQTVSCWHRGGTVMKNFFDWPVCVGIKRV